MSRIRQAAATMKPGAWLIVGGGWTTNQFKERRLPTQAELEMAAPNNPVYVQLGCSWVLMSRSGLRLLNIGDTQGIPAGVKFERDASGKLTGEFPEPACRRRPLRQASAAHLRAGTRWHPKFSASSIALDSPAPAILAETIFRLQNTRPFSSGSNIK
jgi:predicted amidohydrolase YtcJ